MSGEICKQCALLACFLGTGCHGSLNKASPMASTAILAFSPTNCGFGAVMIGSSSAPQGFTISNTSGSLARNAYLALATGTQFVIADSTCGVLGATVTLAPGASCTFKVAFSPTSVGLKTDSLTVTYDMMSATGQISTALLSGSGAGSTVGVGLYVLPLSATVAVNGVQSIVAQTTGTSSKSVTWAATEGGTITGMGTTITFSAPKVGTYIITATSVEDGTKTASATVFVVDAPTARTDHPRLWVTTDDLAKLRGWATNANPMYQNGLAVAASAGLKNANAHWKWSSSGNCTGTPDAGWGDTGGANGWVQYPTEAYAEFFAFMSLVHPDAATRADYARKGCDMLMWVMNQAVLGQAAGVPFRDVDFAIANRHRWWGEGFGLATDWLQGSGVLAATDKATIRKVFLRWSKELVNAAKTTYNHPEPIGVVNSSTLLNNVEQNKWAGNNYYNGHMRNLTLMALSLDAADDAGDPNTINSDGSANCVRAYIKDAIGAWMYMLYAEYEYPDVVAAGLGIPSSTPGISLLQGGLPVEGFEYGAYVGYVMEGLLALHTAGQDDPKWGKQVGLVSSSFWDLWLQAWQQILEPASHTHDWGNGTQTVYQPASYGETLNMYLAGSAIGIAGPVGIYDMTVGNSSRAQEVRWMVKNMSEGGAAKLYSMASDVWGDGNGTVPILYFLLFDPSVGAPSDPRPTHPTEMSVPAYGTLLARTDWTADASWFTYRCTWVTLDHQNGDCGLFTFYRKGEWLTKGHAGYPSGNVLGDEDYDLSHFNNSLALQNNALARNDRYGEMNAQGSQYLTVNNGDPTTVTSLGLGYAFAQSDMTNLYNSSQYGAITDITHASRSLFWIEPDIVVSYDRAVSATAGRFKKWNLNLVTHPSISGTTAIETTASGQKLFITALLPTSAALSSVTINDATYSRVATGEPTAYRLEVQDTGSPSTIRFLHVLEGKDSGSSQTSTALLRSSNGTSFDGAVIGTTAVMFQKTVSDTFTSLTYPASGATAHYVSGLTPATVYSVTKDGSTGQATSDGAGVLTFTAVGTGNIVVK